MKRHFQSKGTIVSARKKKGAPVAHREAADEHAAEELVLYIENTSDLSPDGPQGQGRSVLLNALRKWRKGTYDPEQAVRLFEHLTESGAKRYAKEMGSSEKEWSSMFTPATRHEAAKQLEVSFRRSAAGGEYDHVDTRIGGPRETHETSEQAQGESFTPKLSGSYVGRRVEIKHVAWKSPLAYFKPGQFGYVVGQDQRGGCALTDTDRASAPGETALLISKTRDMRGGAIWFSLEGVRFTGRGAREAQEPTRVAARRQEDRPIGMTYGTLPPFEEFEKDIRRNDPDHNAPYLAPGEMFKMELVDNSEIDLASNYGLDAATSSYSHKSGFEGDETAIYGFLGYLVEQWNDGNEAAGDLASSIMTVLGYEWI